MAFRGGGTTQHGLVLVQREWMQQNWECGECAGAVSLPTEYPVLEECNDQPQQLVADGDFAVSSGTVEG